MEEIRASFKLIYSALEQMPSGLVSAEVRPAPGAEAIGWCESTRGSIYHCIHLDEAGRLARVKVKSPSFSNWRVFPFTVHDSNMMDYAINEASFGLTMAGCDR
jgi:Ni,Fe-hydrogenase III large subunit